MTTDDPAFHFPPDVFDAVVDAVPLLTRGKRDVVVFFRGCGVDRRFLAGIEQRTAGEPAFSKYHATREILIYLNELGDSGLAARRQVLKRISEFDDFSSCYPDNQMKARGAVATVAQLINKKDSFTRLRDEREQELKRHRELDGVVYLVEMKWWTQPLGRGDIASHLVRVYNRGQVGGILISNSPYASSAIADCKAALTAKTVVLVELKEIVQALTLGRSVRDLLTAKIRAAALLKDPLVYPLDEVATAW